MNQPTPSTSNDTTEAVDTRRPDANAGHTLTYANVTEDWKILGQWDGSTALEMTAAVTGTKPVVVVIQEGQFGPIRAAAHLR